MFDHDMARHPLSLVNYKVYLSRFLYYCRKYLYIISLVLETWFILHLSDGRLLEQCHLNKV